MRLKLVFSNLFLVYTFSLVTHAQCSNSAEISITGNTCIGSVLTALSNVQGASVVWKKDGVTVTTQMAAFSGAGVTVAGGNGAGSNANQLLNPNRIYIDASGNLYIPDMSNSRIQKWASGASSGITVAGGNGIGSAANQFDRPTSVALDSKGDIYVTDQSNSRIQKWVAGATAGVSVVQGLSYPTAIFIDAQDNIYVSEQFASLVSKWSPGGTRTIVAGGNGYGSGANQLSTPTGIFMDAAGNIYICDTDNNRVQKWTPGATFGTTVAGGNGFGSAANQLSNPLGIYVDALGNMFISDFNNYRVQKWTPGATSGITVAGGNGSGSGANQLNQPAGIYMDAVCNLFVSDFYNHRVQRFSTKATNTYTALAAGDYTATIVTSAGLIATSNVITVVAPRIPAVTIQANTTTICEGGKATFTAIATNPGPGPTFQWQKNGLNVGTNSSTYGDNNLADGDVITCLLTSNEVCLVTSQVNSNAIVMTVKEISKPVNLGPDIKVCTGLQVVLDAGPGYSSYLWQDGSTNSNFTVTNQGVYYVKVQGACGSFFSDTVLAGHYPNPGNFLPENVKMCSGRSLELGSTTNFKQYLWSTNETAKTINVRSEGLYWLQVADENNCVGRDTVVVRKEECLQKVYIPNGFTPNNDGKNDLLKPIFLDIVKLVRFDIYNRWGQLVFHTTSLDKGWDGKVNGQAQASAVFVWVCSYQFPGQPVKTEKGVVTLIR